MALSGFLMMALGLGIFLAPSEVSAQTATTTPGGTPGGTTAAAQTSGSTITVFCLDFGKAFPEGQTIKASGLADAKIRGGLAYAQTKGYVASNPYQVQLAMWNLQDNQPYHDLQNKAPLSRRKL